MASRSRTTKAEQADVQPADETTAPAADLAPADDQVEGSNPDLTADDHTEAAQGGTSVDTATGEQTIGGASTDVPASESATGEDAVATPGGEVVGGVSQDGFAADHNTPGADADGRKDGEVVNAHGQTVEEARAEFERANDPKRASVNLSAPLDAPSEKAQQTTVVEDPNEGVSIHRGLTTSPTTATPVISDGARLTDADGAEISDPKSIFTKAEGPGQYVTVNQRVYVEEGVPNSKRTTRRLLFPKHAKVHHSTVGVFAAEWADKAAK
jgi:hypothetical protein